MVLKSSKSQKTGYLKRHSFGFLHWLYVLLLLISMILPCYFSYQQHYAEIVAQIDSVYSELFNEYKYIIDNFWQLYMPFFDGSSEAHDVLQKYISAGSDTPLTPVERNALEKILRMMLLRNDDVKWIAIYCEQRSDNYLLLSNSSGLKQLSDDFPYMEELKSSSYAMEIYGTKPLDLLNSAENTFAICGGLPYFIGSGKILVGYSTTPFREICSKTSFSLDSLSYKLTSNGSVIFEYHGPKALQADNLSQVAGFQNLYTQNGELITYHSQTCGRKSSQLAYWSSQWEIFLDCNVNSPLFIALFLLFALVSIWFYMLTLKKMRNEVSVIQYGLDQIGENNLDYCISENFQQEQLSNIAQSINHMTRHLKRNIHLAYYYEIKQRETELAELQSKFNPHFLYNTLEILRSRCEANGDEDTANLICDVSTIFRGLISSRSFIPLSEELAFSKHYLSLFRARYGDSVQVRYDIEKNLLSYGIIKNLFQPLIENYFIHGFDTAKSDNYLLISGKSLDENTMLLTVENNGIDISPEEMKKLNKDIHSPIDISTESYGLKNLHQRLVLFYGAPCGLTIHPNKNASNGISVQIIALKMTCSKYEESRSKQQALASEPE